jgi:hypothetical protein
MQVTERRGRAQQRGRRIRRRRIEEYKNTNFIQPSDIITCTRNLN